MALWKIVQKDGCYSSANQEIERVRPLLDGAAQTGFMSLERNMKNRGLRYRDLRRGLRCCTAPSRAEGRREWLCYSEMRTD
jgi:hypothetical protein